MSIEIQPFGQTPAAQPVNRYTLRSPGRTVTARIITYGGYLTELHTPDRTGAGGDIVLGFDQLDPYLRDKSYLGCLVGRFANRIAGGRFTLDGVQHKLPINNGPNSLHGGMIGLHSVVWQAEPRQTPDGPALELRHQMPDGQDGFPGSLNVTVLYTVTDDSLRIDYTATADRATPVNLTHHAYFNLAGPGRGDVLDHLMQLNASNYTPVDQTLIPTGTIAPVRGTPFDFTTAAPIGQRISQITGGGYDHNYVLDTNGDLSKPAARVYEPQLGRIMEIHTTQPGVQLYTGNFLDGSVRGIGGAYGRHGAFCLETQHFPDSVNRPAFPSTILRPGQTYRQTTIHRFTTDAK